MKTYTDTHRISGNVLFVEKGFIKLGIALDFGLRISYLSYCGSENLFFEQPNDMMELATPDGWRVRGGHRLWIAPESEKNYYPDNEKISYEILDGKIIVSQKRDPWLSIEKSMEISFPSDDSVKIVHKIKNTDTNTKRCSLWGVTSLAPFGTEYIPLEIREGGYDPLHKISMWDYTSLGDERAIYMRDMIILNHKATGNKYKIGVSHPKNKAKYVNLGIVFEKEYEIDKDKAYPDGNVSFETYMCDYMVEMETLSPLYDIRAGESAEYSEIWHLYKSND